MTRMMCLRLLRGVRSGYASADTMAALVTPLFTTHNPGVALWLRVEVRVYLQNALQRTKFLTKPMKRGRVDYGDGVHHTPSFEDCTSLTNSSRVCSSTKVLSWRFNMNRLLYLLSRGGQN